MLFSHDVINGNTIGLRRCCAEGDRWVLYEDGGLYYFQCLVFLMLWVLLCCFVIGEKRYP